LVVIRSRILIPDNFSTSLALRT